MFPVPAQPELHLRIPLGEPVQQGAHLPDQLCGTLAVVERVCKIGRVIQKKCSSASQDDASGYQHTSFREQ